MTSPQEYRQALSKLKQQISSLNIGSTTDTQETLAKLQDFQDRLWELKKRIKSDVNQVWEKYKIDSKGSFGQAIIGEFLGKRMADKMRKNSRERLSKERNELLKGYDVVQDEIDVILEKIKSTKAKLDILLKNKNVQQNADQRSSQNNSKLLSADSISERVNYYEYIKSQAWREKAEEAKARAGNRCEVCNKSRAEVQLDAHHRTYDRLGNEPLEDITVLCRDCHQIYEDAKRIPKPPLIPQTGFCIRCQAEIKCNPKAPYCYSCYKVWKKYENAFYQEKYCHICGKDNESTMTKPACLDCYLEHRHSLEFS
jgi:hypothetical protein